MASLKSKRLVTNPPKAKTRVLPRGRRLSASVRQVDKPNNERKSDAVTLDSKKGISVSARRIFYEKAASRRQRHRLALKQHLNDTDDAVPLGRATDKSGSKVRRHSGGKSGGVASFSMARHAHKDDRSEEERLEAMSRNRFTKILARNNNGRAPGKGVANLAMASPKSHRSRYYFYSY